MSAVVSLGTGMIPVTELKEIDVFRPDSLFDAAKLAYGISAIGKFRLQQFMVLCLRWIVTVLIQQPF